MPEEFHAKLRKLTHLEFDRHDRHDSLSFGLTDDELRAELGRIPATDLYLGHYTEEQIKDRLKKSGIMKKLADMGFPKIHVEIITRDVYNHRLYVHTGVRDYDHILIELRLREGIFRPREQFLSRYPLGPLPMILVDWLMLQNPTRDFDPQRPGLPQQRYPGLGLLQDLIPLVMEVVRETGRAGVLDVPEHYHGALFYSRWFRFFNPETEGKFLAMQRDVGSHPLHVASHAIDRGCLVSLKEGVAENWVPGEQILPLGDQMKGYFNHHQYMDLRDRAFMENRYELDLEKYRQKAGKDKENEVS